MKKQLSIFSICLTVTAFVICAPLTGGAQDLAELERLADQDVKPFVVVQGIGTGAVARAQGVMISPRGHVLTAGHLCFDTVKSVFMEDFLVVLRTRTSEVPAGMVHSHESQFIDRENTVYKEHHYEATVQKLNDSHFVDNRDLAVLKIKSSADFPCVEFFSDDKPKLSIGDTLYLCHYPWVSHPTDPTFLVNPITVTGVAQTPSGLQYLAEGYFRWGSSGGALLKDGKLVGIQCSAYTVNVQDVGEMPMGLLSFHPVHRSMFKDFLSEEAPDGDGATEE